MNLTGFILKNKMLVNLLAGFLLIAGTLSLFRIPREAFPNIDFDIVTIMTAYPGSNASQIERLITSPIEKELKDVDDIKEMHSISSEGVSIISLVIEADAPNKDRVVNEIQRAVDRVNDLPVDLPNDPVVRDMKTKNTPMMEVSLSGPYPQLVLQDWAKKLEDRLREIPEISSVSRQGYFEPQFHVEINPVKLEQYHISLTEVGEALASQNVNVPGGTLVGPSGEMTLRTSGEFFTPEEIQKVIVRANDQGNPLTVGDLASVTLSHERPDIKYKTDGEAAIILWPLKREKEDVFVVKEKILDVFESFKKIAPSDLKISLINDFSYYVKRRLNVLRGNGFIGLFLVMIPIFLFLNRRAAIGALMGMPVALLSAFAVMHALGITINLMSMFGLIMVVGMLVDEDIVIAENIHRLMENGMKPREAIMKGTAEVTRAVVATVLTTITAFVPLMMMTGIMGKFVRQIPLVVVITLLASLVEALIILPAHIASLSKKGEIEEKGSFQERFFGQRAIAWCGEWVRFFVMNRYRVLAAFFVLMMATTLLWIWRVDYINFPRKGIEIFFVRAELPPGTPLEITEEKLKVLEEKIATLPKTELDHFVSEIGLMQNDPNDPFTKRRSDVAQIKVFLTPETGRDRDVDQIKDGLRPLFENLDGFSKVSFDSVQPGPPMGKPVAIRLKGDDFDVLKTKADAVIGLLHKIPGTSDVTTDYEAGKREKRLVIDPARVAQAGLTLTDVARSVRYAYEGGAVTTVKMGDEDHDVLVKFPESLRYEPDSLAQVKISNRLGNLIPLSEVTGFEEGEGIEAIRHFNNKRVVTVTAGIDERVTTPVQVNRAVQEALSREKIDPSVLVDFGGEMEDTTDSLHSFFRAFFLALLLTFIIVAWALSSLGAPFVVLTTVIMGLMGVVIGFAITGEPLSFLALMGVVGMSGIVVDVAILIVDFVHKLDKEGLDPIEAVIEGTKLRIRPIFLTTLTTVLGIIPASIGLGGNDPFIQPMARALNWGIGIGAIMTLIFLPAFLAIARDLKKRWGI